MEKPRGTAVRSARGWRERWSDLRQKALLTLDGVVNLVLGGLLALFPRRVAERLGIPVPSSSFYASILGGVLVGIGLALLIQRFKRSPSTTGLGIEGAIVINFAGAAVLVVWLISGKLGIPTFGYALLWFVALLVLGIGCAELIWRARSARADRRDRRIQDKGAVE
jgi:hypothetical protein